MDHDQREELEGILRETAQDFLYDLDVPCPYCGGEFPEPASQSQMVCQNGHVITLRDLM